MFRRVLCLTVVGAVVGFAVGTAFMLLVAWFNPSYVHAGQEIRVGDGIFVWGGMVAILGAVIGMAAGVAFSPDPADAAVVTETRGHH